MTTVPQVRPGSVFDAGISRSTLPDPDSENAADETRVVQLPIVAGGTPSWEDSDDDDAQPVIPHRGIEAHLAPTDAEVEARIVARLEAEIMRDVELRMIDNLIVATVSVAPSQESIVIADEVMTPSKLRPWMIIMLAMLFILGGIVGGVAYTVGRDDPTVSPSFNMSSQQVDSGQSQSMAPSAAPFSPVPMDFLLDELRDHIAPTNTDLMILKNVTSPQAKALAWLQDDLITRTPGRSTNTVLQRYSLAVLYYSTSGESSWTFPCMNSDDVCRWNMADLNDKGVYCGEDQETVINLAFYGLEMVGSLPWEVILLSDLKTLRIDRNDLIGPIPSQIGELTQLEIFYASGNGLTGTLPETFSSATTRVGLDQNSFTGSLPASWGTTMHLLTAVNLWGNSLTGTIPTTFGKLANLVHLDLLENLLTGTVPSELDQMNSLKELSLEYNLFTESKNGSICDLLAGLQLIELSADCDKLECPCCTSCKYENN